MIIHQTLKRVLKITGLTIASFIGLILIYILAAFSLSRIGVNEQANSKSEVTIYILSNGVHTDIVVPVKTEQIDWSEHVKFENTINSDSSLELLAFGWGDKGFYLETPTWADLKFSIAFKAAFALGKSAIHATFHRELKENESCISINISNAEYQQLINYIKRSFLIDENGNTINIKTTASYGKNDAFYEAVGSYSLLHSCNTWTNNALKACGQKASFWTIHDKGIFYHYENNK